MKTVFIIGVSGSIIAVLLWTRPDSYAELRELPPTVIDFVEVKQLDIQPIVKITGKLQPAHSSGIHFQVSGQVNKRQVEAGQYMKKNSVLLSIKKGDFVDAVKEAEALLKIEHAAIRRDSTLLHLMVQERVLQQQEVARLKKLGEGLLASKSNYEQALKELYRQQAEEARLKHSVDSARSRLVIEQARLNKARRNLQRTTLRAPFSGTINNVHVEVGDYVTSGQVAVEIVQIDHLDLNLEVTGAVRSQLSLGQKITVGGHKNEMGGEIIALAVAPDPQTNTYAVRVKMASTGLYAGQLAIAHLPGHLYKAANVIPISAILYEEGQSYVFELIKDTLYRKAITLIERYNDHYIVDGVVAGSRVVSKDVSSLADGQSVTMH